MKNGDLTSFANLGSNDGPKRGQMQLKSSMRTSSSKQATHSHFGEGQKTKRQTSSPKPSFLPSSHPMSPSCHSHSSFHMVDIVSVPSVLILLTREHKHFSGTKNTVELIGE
ncbi:hypothetical protein BLNAU_18794 [Blattamonas nauphoetae]|uniref:Uncharacterized protein n=1 Tax=Blattamonas nauphoetae TaxID=2049346 RepID=A0ABQ9X3V9_9EUKA|nr:hypothetical protein BLNAU_18794 [Blattamonas nauphoetae]